MCYDLKYALRLCLEHDHKEACVHIYSTMGLYEEAVHLALQVNIAYGLICHTSVHLYSVTRQVFNHTERNICIGFVDYDL